MDFNFMNRSGIYKITNVINNKCYIGSAILLRKRFNLHKSQLNRNVHFNCHLQAAWNKYGEENFKFEVLQFCENVDLIKNEQNQIDWYKPEYNILKIAGSPLGRKHSKETINKMKLSQLGEKHHAFGKPAKNKGVKVSLETREKLRKSHIGKPAWNKGIPMSEKQKERLLGNKYSCKRRSEETKRKQSELATGKRLSIETIIKREATKATLRLTIPSYGKVIK